MLQDGLTMLHLASQEGNDEVIRMLLKARADVNKRDSVSEVVAHHTIL